LLWLADLELVIQYLNGQPGCQMVPLGAPLASFFQMDGILRMLPTASITTSIFQPLGFGSPDTIRAAKQGAIRAGTRREYCIPPRFVECGGGI